MAAALWPLAAVRADGLTPPRPYNYLHPPPALARSNHRPDSVRRVVSASGGKSTPSVVLFTHDGQAGLGAKAHAFLVDRSSTSVLITIDPINTPGHLPSPLSADGNAYRFAAVGLPDKKPAKTVGQMGMVLRWPRTPYAIYTYQAGRWKLLCDSRNWQISPGLLVCNISSLGVFLAVHRPVQTKPR
jgi:hypothetical protein